MDFDIVLALTALILAVWEARRVRQDLPHARTVFVVWLFSAAVFTGFAVHDAFLRQARAEHARPPPLSRAP